MRDQLRKNGGPSASPSIGDQVRERAIGAGNARRELSKESQPGVDERTLAVSGREETSLPGRLTRIVHRKNRLVPLVPLPGEIQSARLSPPCEISLTKRIGLAQDGVVGDLEGHRGVLVGYPLLRNLERVGADLLRHRAQTVAGAVLDDQRPSA